MTDITENNEAPNGPSASKAMLCFPAQCSCGHIYLEKYQFQKPTDEGIYGFCWCGFCRTRLNLYVDGRCTEIDGASKGKGDPKDWNWET